VPLKSKKDHPHETAPFVEKVAKGFLQKCRQEAFPRSHRNKKQRREILPTFFKVSIHSGEIDEEDGSS
jgi:hypothetical protein